MDLREKIETLKQKIKEITKHEDEFEIKHGRNGVVLIPLDLELTALCVKLPMSEELKRIVDKKIDQSKEFEEDEKSILKDLVSTNGSIREDIESYKEIIQDEELRKYVPTFYYPDTTKEGSELADYIIMDYIDGVLEQIVGKIPSCGDEDYSNYSALEKTYCLFRTHGFEFGDNIEGIYDNKKKQIFIVDLGGVRKLN